MPVLAIFTGQGISKDNYDKLRAEVGWEKNRPAGAMSHVASFDDANTAHVVDVWESADAMNAFVSARLAPAMQKLGLPMPKVEVYETHNINAYPGLAVYQLR